MLASQFSFRLLVRRKSQSLFLAPLLDYSLFRSALLTFMNRASSAKQSAEIHCGNCKRAPGIHLDLRLVILHAAKNEAGLNCWKLCVMSDWSFTRCLLWMFSRLPSIALRKSANVL